jgi:hypothetical protein
MRKVGVEKGVEWIGDGVRIFLRYPGPFLLMGLIYTAISLVPFGLGVLVIFLLGPALLGGIIHASRTATAGQAPRLEEMFQAFKEGDRIGSFIALCLPTLAFVVILVVLAIPIFAAVIHALPGGELDPQSASDRAAIIAALKSVLPHVTGRLALFFLAMIVLGFIGSMLTFFASARIMLDKDTAFAAMRTSFRACTRNFGAYFVCMLLIGVGIFLLQVLFSLLLPRILVTLFTAVPLNALLGPIVFSAYRTIFGTPEADSALAGATAPPAAPTHTLQA